MSVYRKTFLAVLVILSFLASTLATFHDPALMAQPEEVPREEAVLISDAWGPPAGWNPALPAPSWGEEILYLPLFMYSTLKDVWLPILAEDYEWIDKYTIEVTIRDEAEWWDGKPVTAHDVEWTFAYGKKYVVPFVSPNWDYLEAVEAVGDKTVRFVTSEEKLNYFQLLGALTTMILPKHRWELLEADLGEKVVTEFRDDDPDKIVGSSPYRLHSWTEDVWYYIRVDDWWGKDLFGLPTPKYVGHVTFKDNVAAGFAFEAGEYDGAGHFFAKIYEMWEVKGLARRTYYADTPYFIGSGLIHLYVNYQKYPLNDLDVRRAIAHAVPYDDLVSKAYFNYSVRASPSMIIHTFPAYTKWIDNDLIDQYRYDLDLEKAKSILDDADIIDRDGDGVREMPDGTPLKTFTIQVPYGWTDWMMACDMIATNLQDIGIDTVTEFPDFSIWWERLGKGNFDLVMGWSASIGYDHPWNMFRWVMDPRLSHPAGNWERYANWGVVPLIDAAAKESDPDKLKVIYSQLQEMALKDLPGIPLFYGAAWYEYSEDYWVGWPAEERPDVWISPYPWDQTNNLPWLFCLAKKGETPSVPSWILDLQFPTSKFFDDLAKVPEPTPPITATELEEIKESISALSEDVATLTDAAKGSATSAEVSALSDSVSSLSQEVSALRGELSTIVMLGYVEIVLLLVVVVVAVLALRKPPS